MAIQTAALGQGGLASRAATCLQIVRPMSSQNASHLSGSFAPPALVRSSQSRHARISCSATEDFPVVEQKVKSTLPRDLNLSLEQPSAADKSRSSTSAFDAVEIQDDSGQVHSGTVREVFQAAVKAVEDASVMSVGQTVLFGGTATLGLLVSASVMKSLEFFPLAPEALQTVGVAYSILTASQLLQGIAVTFPPKSPFKAVIELVDNGQTSTVNTRETVQQDVDEKVAANLKSLVKERDAAVSQMEDMRKATANYARVVAEKEALEAVSLQLADERDGALSEVSALKDAVMAMTSRMKAIEEMLEQEVSQLKQQNQALETVALQLADERDSAVQEMEDLRSSTLSKSLLEEEKQSLEEVAIQLAQERDTALAEIEDLKKVVASIRESTTSSSGLTSEQEAFIKARVRAIRSQFIKVDKAYEDQKDEVDRFIGHLVKKYGAPPVWTENYIHQFLASSATKLKPATDAGNSSHLENRPAQSRSS